MPPGYLDYLDKNKNEGSKYGDFIIWKQILKKNKEVNQPVIFITSEKKEDWFLKLKKEDKTLGPRPELLMEFFKEKANLFYIYRTEEFLEYSRKYFKTVIKDETIKEVKAVEESKMINKKDAPVNMITDGIYDYFCAKRLEDDAENYGSAVTSSWPYPLDKSHFLSSFMNQQHLTPQEMDWLLPKVIYSNSPESQKENRIVQNKKLKDFLDKKSNK